MLELKLESQDCRPEPAILIQYFHDCTVLPRTQPLASDSKLSFCSLPEITDPKVEVEISVTCPRFWPTFRICFDQEGPG